MSNVLAKAATLFTGKGCINYTPRTWFGETKCPKSLL